MKRIAFSILVAAFTTFAAAQSVAKDLADGEVRKVDKASGTVIIKHGEIRSVNMGPMTMAFSVKPPALLDKVAVGDKVKFRVVQEGGDYVVTAIEKAK
jgi:Cu(I)/Ag(I) efflux system protein CusF